jgi:glutaryl-CoA dehydrogenase (non-decarboxylating)
MNFDWTEEQVRARHEFRAFVDKHIAPFAHEFEVREQVPREVVKQLAKAGFLGCMVPKPHGGGEYDSLKLAILSEELNRGSSAVRGILTVHGMVSLAVSRWGTKQQQERWLPGLISGETLGAFALTEPNVGNDARNIEMVATDSSDRFMLNGKKKWTSFGQIADLFLVFAKVDGRSTAFLVDRKSRGLTIQPLKALLGGRANMLAEMTFENCEVPRESMIGPSGMGMSHVANFSLDFGRFTIACGCVGMGRACLDACISYCSRRKQFGELLGKHQLIQQMLCQMTVDVEAASLLCYQAGYLRQVGAPDSLVHTWLAKYFASKMVNRVAGQAVQVHGANGCAHDSIVGRFFAEAKAMEIVEGTSQMHEVLIGKSMSQSVHGTPHTGDR